MGKQKSLFYQFKTSIEFVPNFDKHSDKRQDFDSSHVVKSLQSKSNLLDFSHQFSDFIKSEYSVKQVKHITPEMCQSFIDKKISDGVTLETAKSYQSLLNKLEVCVNHTFHTHISYRTSVDPSKIVKLNSPKEYSFTRSELDRILNVSKPSESSKVIKFNSFSGCRINTCEKLLVRDIRIDGDIVTIDIHKDKGGRDRSIVIKDAEFAEYCRSLRKYKNPSDKVFNIKKDSVNKWLNRRCHSLGINKSGNHSVRKLVAETYSKKHGIGKTMEFLGHGKDRPDLENTYLHSKK